MISVDLSNSKSDPYRTVNKLPVESLIAKNEISTKHLTFRNNNDLSSFVTILLDEIALMQKFQGKVYEISKSMDQLNMSIIENMKNLNFIIEHFNATQKIDDSLHKKIEAYIRMENNIFRALPANYKPH